MKQELEIKDQVKTILEAAKKFSISASGTNSNLAHLFLEVSKLMNSEVGS